MFMRILGDHLVMLSMMKEGLSFILLVIIDLIFKYPLLNADMTPKSSLEQKLNLVKVLKL
jgi:hypothetical protein